MLSYGTHVLHHSTIFCLCIEGQALETTFLVQFSFEPRTTKTIMITTANRKEG